MRIPASGGADEAAAHESWLRVSDGLIAGVHHALNNRMAALGAVAQVLEADLPPDHPLSGAMSRELERLEDTAGLLTLLVRGGDAEPVQLEALVADAQRLFEMHHALRDLKLEVELAAGLYPLWIDPSALLRALVIMLSVGGRHAFGGGRLVRLDATGDARTVEIGVEAMGNAGPDEAMEDAEGLAGIAPEGAAGLLDRWGGEVKLETREGKLRITVTLPTLPEARKQQ